MKKQEATPIEAKEHILNAQAVMCLVLKNNLAPEMTRFIKMAVTRLELVKDTLGKCEYDDAGRTRK